MNPYYYLFYKLSRFLSRKGNNENGPIFAISILIGWNIGMIYIKILPVTQANFQSNYKYGIIVIGVFLFVVNYILFLDERRVKSIVNRYKEESERNKKVGNFLVILYIVLSIGLIVFW